MSWDGSVELLAVEVIQQIFFNGLERFFLPT
jgi:hypothetical protein